MKKTALLLFAFLLPTAGAAWADDRVHHSHAIEHNGIKSTRTLSSGTWKGKRFEKMTIHTLDDGKGGSSTFTRGHVEGQTFHKLVTVKPLHTDDGVTVRTSTGAVAGKRFESTTKTVRIPGSPGSMRGGTYTHPAEGTDGETP